MKNAALVDLNFRTLLHYGCPPTPHHTYPSHEKPNCTGYCVSCESGETPIVRAGCLDLMSHGCDTSDFERFIGESLPSVANRFDKPVMFLLEDPGGWKKNGEVVLFQHYNKQPPINHYYWVPYFPDGVKKWAQRHEVPRGSYGSYFAYLMVRHGLVNTYITNVVKCRVSRAHSGLKQTDTYTRVRRNCSQFLASEMELHDPRIVFCFGGRAEQGFLALGQRRAVCRLYHPATRRCTCSWDTLMSRNDARIEEAIKRL